jgi:hypothetical protein
MHSTNDVHVCEIFYKHSSFYIYLLKMWMLWQILCFEWLGICFFHFSFINVTLKFCSDTSPNELLFDTNDVCVNTEEFKKINKNVNL